MSQKAVRRRPLPRFEGSLSSCYFRSVCYRAFLLSFLVCLFFSLAFCNNFVFRWMAFLRRPGRLISFGDAGAGLASLPSRNANGRGAILLTAEVYPVCLSRTGGRPLFSPCQWS